MANGNVEIIQEIISELNALQNSEDPPNTRHDGPIPFPRLLSGKNNAQILVNKRIDQLIHDLGRETYNGELKIDHIATLQEWRHTIRSFIGDELTSDIDFTNEEVAAEIVSKNLQDYKEKIVSTPNKTEWAFPATIFYNVTLEPFRVGPVLIEMREDWLTRKFKEGAVSKTTKRRLENKWSNGKVNRPRNATNDSLFEREIDRAAKDHKFMITVGLECLLPDAAQKRAETLANLTLVALACIWENPSDALKFFYLADDGSNRSINRLKIDGRYIFSRNERLRFPGKPINEDNLCAVFSDNKEYWHGITHIFDFLATSRPETAKKALYDSLSQAIIFFQRACIETSDLMSVMNFAMTLDALAQGGRSKGIVKMIQGLTGWRCDKVITRSGQTIKYIVERIYSDARSRTVHGTSERYHLDWQELREIATYITRRCLTQAIGRAGELKHATCMSDLFYDRQD